MTIVVAKFSAIKLATEKSDISPNEKHYNLINSTNKRTQRCKLSTPLPITLQRKVSIRFSLKLLLTNMRVLDLGDPNQAAFFGSMGIVAALVFANLGAAYGTAKSGVGIVSVAVLKPELIFRSIIPVVMAGVLGMYGMIIAILIKGQRKFINLIPVIQSDFY